MDHSCSKSADSTFVKLKRFIGLITILVLAAFVSGCYSHTIAGAGDAKVVRHYVWLYIGYPGTKFYSMKFPSVNIANKGTTTFGVRNLPPYLAGKFSFDAVLLSHSLEQGPWNDARIAVVFKRLDGSLIARREIVIHAETEGFDSPTEGFRDPWSDTRQQLFSGIHESSFDILMTVEEPSKRKTDRIALEARASIIPEKRATQK